MARTSANHFNSHAGLFNLLLVRQSACWRFHSTETAVAIAYSNSVCATDPEMVSALVLLDLSASYVDHCTLLEVLLPRFEIKGGVFEWFKSYLTGWTQTMAISFDISAAMPLVCSVPKGLVVSPLLFIVYTEDIKDNIDVDALEHDLYATILSYY